MSWDYIYKAQNKVGQVNELEIINLYRSKKRSMKELARDFSISTQRLVYILKNHNIPLRPRGCPSGQERNLKRNLGIVKLRAKGMKPQDIADKYGINRWCVYEVLAKRKRNNND